jgi:uncharacterized protein YndB with AHSA1/START domain
MNPSPVIIETILNAPAEAVWQAITDKNKMEKWYFKVPEFKPEVGFEFKYYGGEEGGRRYPTSCKILAVEPGRKLVHTWSYDDYPHQTIVTFELFPEGAKTKLRLTHEGLETMPPEYPGVSAQDHREGWTHIIGTSLKQFVEKQP